MGQGFGIDLAVLRSRNLRGIEQPQPAPSTRFRRLVQSQLQVDVDHPRRVLGALEIAAHPVQTVRDSRKHGCLPPTPHARSTHVSLLPPPCEEFTTSDPRRNATRVKPPGTRVTFSPYKM